MLWAFFGARALARRLGLAPGGAFFAAVAFVNRRRAIWAALGWVGFAAQLQSGGVYVLGPAALEAYNPNCVGGDKLAAKRIARRARSCWVRSTSDPRLAAGSI